MVAKQTCKHLLFSVDITVVRIYKFLIKCVVTRFFRYSILCSTVKWEKNKNYVLKYFVIIWRSHVPNTGLIWEFPGEWPKRFPFTNMFISNFNQQLSITFDGFCASSQRHATILFCRKFIVPNTFRAFFFSPKNFNNYTSIPIYVYSLCVYKTRLISSNPKRIRRRQTKFIFVN